MRRSAGPGRRLRAGPRGGVTPRALAALCPVWEDARGGPPACGTRGKEEEGSEPRKLLEKASCWRSGKAKKTGNGAKLLGKQRETSLDSHFQAQLGAAGMTEASVRELQAAELDQSRLVHLLPPQRLAVSGHTWIPSSWPVRHRVPPPCEFPGASWARSPADVLSVGAFLPRKQTHHR